MLLRICSVYLGCGLRYSSVLSNLPTNTKVFFAQFMTTWKKQILARAIRI